MKNFQSFIYIFGLGRLPRDKFKMKNDSKKVNKISAIDFNWECFHSISDVIA